MRDGTTPNYRHTLSACCFGYITQAIVNSFAPLLFLTFQSEFGIPLEQITLLVTLNFCIQLTVDLLSVKLVDKIGYRPCAVAANLFAALGLVGLGTLPSLLPDPYIGLLCSVALYAVGVACWKCWSVPSWRRAPSRTRRESWQTSTPSTAGAACW